jgi:hypothetical protein
VLCWYVFMQHRSVHAPNQRIQRRRELLSREMRLELQLGAIVRLQRLAAPRPLAAALQR